MFRKAGQLSAAVLLCALAACTEATTPDAPSAAFRASTAALPVDTAFHIRILPNLDGNNVVVTAFNRYDVVTGYTAGAGSRIFRSRTSIEYFTPPSGFLPGGWTPFGPGINDGGKVVTGLASDTSLRAVIWWHNDGSTLLEPTYPHFDDEADGCGAGVITNGGMIGGYCFTDANLNIAVWRPDLTILYNECCGDVTSMTDNGHLTGYLLLNVPQAFIWKPGAAQYSMIDSEPRQSVGLAVNPHGWVAGYADVEPVSAVLWVPGQPARTLSHIGEATGIDTAGNIVGYHQETTTSPTIAFFWNFATGAHFLPGLPGGGATTAVAISSENREILGSAVDADGLKHAVIWSF